jgi:ethanolamine utilization protein EutQ (cupin superfamily)
MFKALRLIFSLVCVVSTGLAQNNSGGATSVPEDLRLQHVEGVEGMDIAPWGDDIPAYFEDVISNGNAEIPMTCAMFRMEQGEPLEYHYEYDDIKFVLDGSFTVSDGHSEVTAGAGDVLFFPAGSTITFTSDDYGLGWACGNR